MRRAAGVALLALVAGAGCVRFEEFPIALVDGDLVDDPQGTTFTYGGEYTTMAMVQISTDSVTWVNIGLRFSVAPTAPTAPAGGPSLATSSQLLTTLGLQTGESVPILRAAAVRGGTYHFARLVQMPFLRNTSGTAPGVLAPVSVAKVSGTLGDTAVTVADTRFAQSLDLLTDRRIEPLTLREGDRVTVTWDLNSDQWLTREALRTKRIDRALARAAPTVAIVRQ